MGSRRFKSAKATSNIVVWLLLLLSIIPAAKPLSLSLLPTACIAPCTMRATIRYGDEIEAGREVCLIMDDGLPTSSCWPHGGQRILQVMVKNIQAGDYMVMISTQGHKASAMLVVG